jgi:hypothetical protein
MHIKSPTFQGLTLVRSRWFNVIAIGDVGRGNAFRRGRTLTGMEVLECDIVGS